MKLPGVAPPPDLPHAGARVPGLAASGGGRRSAAVWALRVDLIGRTATEALIERVVDESGRLAAGPRHENLTARQIRENTLARAV